MDIVQNINSRLRKVPAWPLYILGMLPAGFYFYWAVANQLGADPLLPTKQQWLIIMVAWAVKVVQELVVVWV